MKVSLLKGVHRESYDEHDLLQCSEVHLGCPVLHKLAIGLVLEATVFGPCCMSAHELPNAPDQAHLGNAMVLDRLDLVGNYDLNRGLDPDYHPSILALAHVLDLLCSHRGIHNLLSLHGSRRSSMREDLSEHRSTPLDLWVGREEGNLEMILVPLALLAPYP